MFPTDPITRKDQMYRLLMGGAFGNTNPSYNSLDDWYKSLPDSPIKTWGIRSLDPGGPCQFYVPTLAVPETCAAFIRQGSNFNISPMIDYFRTVTLWADVFDDPAGSGLKVYGIEYPKRGASWREFMPIEGKTWEGTLARCLLRKHLNPSSLADLWAIFEHWPNHVVELSAVEGTYGTVPGRNAVIWEVRNY